MQVSYRNACAVLHGSVLRLPATAQFERVMESNDPRLDLADIVSTAITRADIVRHAEMNDAESGKSSHTCAEHHLQRKLMPIRT